MERNQTAEIALLFQDIAALDAVESRRSGRNDISFVVEHESCFQGLGVRSVYELQGLAVARARKLILIHGQPHGGDIYSQDRFPHQLPVDYHNIPSGSRFEVRRSLMKRGSMLCRGE